MPPDLDRVFAALSDPTRRGVVERLVRGPASVSDLHNPQAMALPTFLRHLRVLEDCGLVQSEKAGRVRTLRMVPAALGDAERWLDRQRRHLTGRVDRLQALAEAVERGEAQPPPGHDARPDPTQDPEAPHGHGIQPGNRP